ncbi:ABC transporter permease [Methanocella arvoryzae]|uniref:ABC-type transport system, permease component n=1 Tax=Methanocella arvoryzae (strain DSM 22066 / NBRC 105507 / MRE50) TaxID=351160 RepID=Q0W2I0_METAR|nr:ABC transporter permease [Methanocella arvoryzae]CAJ37413.1 ABC-type transport system, permease component [Methanocella arvoryzae MRE50]
MIDIALKNMWQRKTRTGLTVIAIAVCIMLFLVLSTATGTMDQMFADSQSRLTGQIYVKTPSAQSGAVPEFPPVSSSMTMEQADQLMMVAGIDEASSSPLLLVPQAPSLFQNGPPQVIVVGITPGKEKAFYGDALIDSPWPIIRLGDRDVILGAYAAGTHYKVNVGDQITVQNRNLTVAGIAQPTGSIIVDGMVLMPLNVAQEIFNRPGVSTVMLTAPSEDKVDSVAAAVRTQFPELEVMTQKDVADTLNSMASTTHTFMGMINLTMLVVAGVVTLMVMFMSVSERTKEFGMLRAIGASRLKILAMVMEESVIICLIGSAVGVLISFVVMKIMFGAAFASVDVILRAVLFMTVIGIIAGLIPAYRSAKIQPLEAIRYE